MLAAAGVLGANALGQSTLTSSRAFHGKMNSQSQPVRLDLPDGAVVEEILVSNGDSVRRGQTLVTFDQAAIEEAIAGLQDLNRKDQMTLRCLASGTDNLLQPVSDWEPSDHGSSQCVELTFEAQRLEQNFSAQSAKTEQEILLINTYLVEASASHRRHKDSAGSNATLDRILALSLTKTALENAQTVAQAEHRNALHDLALRKSDLLAATKNVLHDRKKKLSALSKLLENPRLHAPFSGKIIRLRHLPTGHVAITPTEVLSLLPQREIGYVVQFQLPGTDAKILEIGETISVETIGLPALLDRLKAVVSGISRGDQGQLVAQADLTLEATQRLAESPYSRQILANSSAVTVRIHKLPVRSSDSIKNTLTGAIVIQNTTGLAEVIAGANAIRDWVASTP